MVHRYLTGTEIYCFISQTGIAFDTRLTPLIQSLLHT